MNNQLTHARRQVGFLITRKDIQSNLKFATTGSKKETALKEDRPDLIDQRGSLHNQARSNHVPRLNIELLLALEVGEPHCRTRRGFRDALRVHVILLRFNIGANILGRHQSHFASSCSEKSTKVVSAATCFHSNDGRHLAYKLNERLTSHRSADNHRAFVINSDNAQLFSHMSMPSIEIVMILDVPERAGDPITNSYRNQNGNLQQSCFQVQLKADNRQDCGAEAIKYYKRKRWRFFSEGR